jgi:GTPase SAR1 family protein
LDGENYRLDIIDTAGEEEFSPLRDQNYRSDAFAFVYSLLYPRTLQGPTYLPSTRFESERCGKE